jgi:hypothetical protein
MAIHANRKRVVRPIAVISAGILGASALGVTTRVNAAPDPGKTSAGPFGTVEMDPGLIATASCALVAGPAPGLKAGDHVVAQPPIDLEPSLASSGATTQMADGTLFVRLCNITAAGVDGAARDWAYLVLR